MQILLADDHSMFRFGLRRIISDQFNDAQVDEAGSCAQCLEAVHKREYDLIVLDLSMHGQNSLSILPQIKEKQRGSPILVLSMHSDTQLVVEALKAGASGYLTKEHTAEELVWAISTVLAGRRYLSASLAENLADYVAVGKSDSPHEALSSRERQVFMLIASGLPLTEIAARLSLSKKTVSTYRTRILEKMAMGSNAELMRYAMRHRLID